MESYFWLPKAAFMSNLWPAYTESGCSIFSSLGKFESSWIPILLSTPLYLALKFNILDPNKDIYSAGMNNFELFKLTLLNILFLMSSETSVSYDHSTPALIYYPFAKASNIKSLIGS